VLGRHPRAVVVGSHSKDLAVPGERIGFIVPTPEIPDAERRELVSALTFVTRTLGFVNASALMQRVVREVQGATVPPAFYEERSRLLCDALERAGYELVRPGGAFYLFPKTPDPDDVGFVRRLQEKLVLTVPGSGFGAPGHFRISYCVGIDKIERALPALVAVAGECRAAAGARDSRRGA
jgi:aspartate aminotransferase